MTADTFSPGTRLRDNNQPSNVSSMYYGGISIETYSAGAGRDVTSMVDNEHLKYTATLSLYNYNLENGRLTDEFFRSFATLIL